MLKRCLLYFAFLIFTLDNLHGNDSYYNNKIIFYVDNKISDFNILDDQKYTSLKNLNIVKKIFIIQVIQMKNSLLFQNSKN